MKDINSPLQKQSIVLVTQANTISFRAAFLFWLKLGFISFGGPAGQIAIMHQELVERRLWISEKRFLHALNYCMLLPGPEAQQLATYIGWLMHRTWGGIVAGVLFILPSLFILIILSWIYVAFGHLPLVEGLFYGIKPAVAMIVLQAAYRIGSKVLKNKYLWVIAAASFLAASLLSMPFPLVVLLAALTGYVGGRFAPNYFALGGGHATNTVQKTVTAVIDDDTPSPEHATFYWWRCLSVLLIGALLWCIPMGLLSLFYGWNSPLTQMSWFFSKAALLTFGGAYAVLPYVYQGAVGHYGWVTAGQMMDGLALGETTPGPLIMIVAFVGFVGGYLHVTQYGHPFLMGVCAASLVTWFTFLPSFIFILAGGPLVESTRKALTFTAPLTAITAAVVGVILNLACFFGIKVIFPQGITHSVDWISLLIMLGAGIALFYFKRHIIHVLLACAVLGVLIKMG